jgi:DNA (cytosine-5)-methyltransferase 1
MDNAMKFLSVCSGIEAASVAWNPIGWEAVGFSEIEPFPCGLLKHHYPSVPNFGDMTKFKEWPDATIDVLCGGTPCQSFSVAGLRKGLDDPRGNLMLTFLAIAKRYRPQWVVWENVPGVLSSNGGRDFGSFLGGLAECGYGFAYRVLDAQYFGVAQRRKRVFVVGYLGDWHRAAAVLFEQHSLQGHPAPSRETRKRITPKVTNGPPFSRTGNERVEDQALVWPADVASTLNAHFGDKQGLEDQHALGGGHCSSLPQVAMCLNAGGMKRQDSESETLIPTIGGGFDAQAFDWQSGGDSRGLDPKPTAQLQACQVPAVMQPVTYDFFNITAPVNKQNRQPGDPCHTLARSNTEHAVMMQQMQVRRLTPEECEALQGFPRSYTQIPWRKKPASECPDGPRYKALGNSWAVPVARWIGERINKVEAWTS